jgi:carbon-monoxide dehydrogenase medium subunit
MPFFRLSEYFKPHSIEEAVSLLSTHEQARIIAGGTDMLVDKPHDVKCLVDPSDLNLSYIKSEENSIKIGTLTPVRDIELSELLREGAYWIFSKAASELGSWSIRNMATIGGNICNGSPCANFAPILMVFDSSVKAIGSKGEKIVPIKDFFVDVKKTTLSKDELLVEIQLPKVASNSLTGFMKLTRQQTRNDLALVSVAALINLDSNGICQDAKISLGAVAPTPIRASKAEEMLKGKKVDDSVLDEVSNVASEETSPISDVRASAEYRKEMSKVLVKRALMEALGRKSR